MSSREQTGDRRRPGVVILQTVSPDYRQAVWQTLTRLSPHRVLIIAGTRYFSPSIVTRHRDGSALLLVQNRFLFNHRVLVQRLPVRALLRADVVIAELNPRIVTTWLVLIARRLMGRRSVLWGHAFSGSGPSGNADRVRRLMRRMADTLVVYTESERTAVSRHTPHRDVVVAPNALFTREQMQPRPTSRPVRDFVYVGRLIADKRPDLLVRAFLRAADRLPPGSRLLMVGDGPLRDQLEREVADAGLGDRVKFLGHVGDLEGLRGIYLTALASVSPGYVGLSIIQSLAFGVPMIIADHEPHSPEIEAADPGLNCVFFRAGSVSALADALLAVHAEAGDWQQRAPAISADCRRRYSVEVLAERLLDACRPPARRAQS